MLKAVVTDLNTVDEAHRGFYVEKDSKFFLNVTPVDGYELDNVNGLKSALGAERNLKKTLEDQLKVYDGIDPTLARQAIDRVSAFGDITPDKARAAVETAARLSALDPQKEAERIAAEKLEVQKAQMQQQFTTREQELMNKVEQGGSAVNSLTGQLQTLMRDNTIKSELAKLNPLDDARDAIEILAAQNIKTSVVNGQVVVEVIDANGNPRIKDHLGSPFTVSDLMAELREKKPGLFKPDEKRGIGLNPTNTPPLQDQGVKNPWTKEHRNMTQQMILEKSQPELAKQLKAAAGVND
jgi:hypothetical protein